jgi:hypothetical protein
MGLTKLSQTHFYSMAGGRGVEPRFAESEWHSSKKYKGRQKEQIERRY